MSDSQVESICATVIICVSFVAAMVVLGGAHGYKLVPIEQSENGGVQ